MNDDTMYLPRDSWSAEDLEFWDKMARDYSETIGKPVTFELLTIGCFHLNPEYAVTDMLVWFSDMVPMRLKAEFAQKLLNELYAKFGLHQKKPLIKTSN